MAKATIQEAIAHWRALADSQRAEPGQPARERAQLYERTARSLEIQRDTGRAVCACCHKPL